MSGSSQGWSGNTQQEPICRFSLHHAKSRQRNKIFVNCLHGSDHHEIDLALKAALIRYGHNLYEENILPIFPLYDDRVKFSKIRAKIRGLKARIESGKDTPLMRRILRKTVNGKEKFLEDAQEINTMIPPSSSTEDKSETEMSWSSKERGVRTLQEPVFSKSWSSKGQGVRPQQELKFSIFFFKVLELEGTGCSHSTRVTFFKVLELEGTGFSHSTRAK